MKQDHLTRQIYATAAMAPIGFSPRDRYAARIRFDTPNEGAGGGDGGGGDAPTIKNPDLLKDPAIRALVEAEIAGLKGKNAELLAKLEKASKGNSLTDAEMAEFRAIKEKLASDEEVQLFLNGDREAYNERITKKVRRSYEEQLSAATATVTELETRATHAETALQRERIENRLSRASADAGVDPQYTDAVALLLRDKLFVDDDGAVRVLDPDGGEGDTRVPAYGKDGKPMSVLELVEDLRKAKPALFLKPSGGGATGGAGGGRGGTLDYQTAGTLSMDEYVEARKNRRIR